MIPTNIFMIDIETAGTAYGSAITEIAAAEFNPQTAEVLRSWSIDISLTDCLKHGLTTDPDTLSFHQRLKNQLSGKSSLWKALNALYCFLHTHTDEIEVWAWGSDFEAKHLEAACKSVGYGTEPLWKYWQLNDARTIWKHAFPGIRHSKRPHRADRDVAAQITDLCSALNAEADTSP